MGVQSPSTLPSVCIDPLKPLPTGQRNTEGFRITPCNLSESICRNIQLINISIPLAVVWRMHLTYGISSFRIVFQPLTLNCLSVKN